MSAVLLRYPAFSYLLWVRRVKRVDPAKANLVLTALFFVLLLLAGWQDRSFVLLGAPVGLFEHPGPWIYLVGQAVLPFVVRKSVLRLEDLEDTVPGALTEAYVAAHLPPHRRFIRDWVARRTPWSKALYNLLTSIGFAILAWNSYSNQRPFPEVGFEFWDSISFPWAYAITRFEKLYFWMLLMPCLFHLQVLVVFRMSQLLIHAAKHRGLALMPYHEDGAGGTRALIDTVLNPLMPSFFFASMLSFGTMAVHRKFDPTTVGSLALTCILFLLIYLVPAVALRNAIVVEKRRQMAEIARQQQQLYVAIVAGKPASDDVGTIVQLTEVADHIRHLPLWPQFAKVARVASLAMGSPTMIWAYQQGMAFVTKWSG